jgi:hypothetical protein
MKGISLDMHDAGDQKKFGFKASVSTITTLPNANIFLAVFLMNIMGIYFEGACYR